jgi:hypothetical protein
MEGARNRSCRVCTEAFAVLRKRALRIGALEAAAH